MASFRLLGSAHLATRNTSRGTDIIAAISAPMATPPRGRPRIRSRSSIDWRIDSPSARPAAARSGNGRTVECSMIWPGHSRLPGYAGHCAGMGSGSGSESGGNGPGIDSSGSVSRAAGILIALYLSPETIGLPFRPLFSWPQPVPAPPADLSVGCRCTSALATIRSTRTQHSTVCLAGAIRSL